MIKDNFKKCCLNLKNDNSENDLISSCLKNTFGLKPILEEEIKLIQENLQQSIGKYEENSELKTEIHNISSRAEYIKDENQQEEDKQNDISLLVMRQLKLIKIHMKIIQIENNQKIRVIVNKLNLQVIKDQKVKIIKQVILYNSNDEYLDEELNDLEENLKQLRRKPKCKLQQKIIFKKSECVCYILN